MPDDTKQVLLDAIKGRLQALVDQEITPRSLLEMSRFADSARNMLSAMDRPEAGKRGRRASIVEYDDSGTYMTSSSDVPASQAETFGASYMRERVAASGILSPREMIDALVAARTNHLDDIADRLDAVLKETIGRPGSLEPKADSAGFKVVADA